MEVRILLGACIAGVIAFAVFVLTSNMGDVRKAWLLLMLGVAAAILTGMLFSWNRFWNAGKDDKKINRWPWA